jgi:hypothetical protein
MVTGTIQCRLAPLAHYLADGSLSTRSGKDVSGVEPEFEVGPEALQLLPEEALIILICPIETACRTCTPRCTQIL